jgi:hypothetical protein
MLDSNCSKCGRELAAAAVLYDESGNVTCDRCQMAKAALDSRKDVAKKVRHVALVGLLAALISLVRNPFFFFTLAGVLNGMYVLRSVSEPEMAKLLEGSVEKIKVMAIAGMVLGGLGGVLHLVLRAAAG